MAPKPQHSLNSAKLVIFNVMLGMLTAQGDAGLSGSQVHQKSFHEKFSRLAIPCSHHLCDFCQNH